MQWQKQCLFGRELVGSDQRSFLSPSQHFRSEEGPWRTSHRDWGFLYVESLASLASLLQPRGILAELKELLGSLDVAAGLEWSVVCVLETICAS